MVGIQLRIDDHRRDGQFRRVGPRFGGPAKKLCPKNRLYACATGAEPTQAITNAQVASVAAFVPAPRKSDKGVEKP